MSKYAAWTPVKIPGNLMERIDELLEGDNPWGYRSKQEIVTAAVRAFLQDKATR